MSTSSAGCHGNIKNISVGAVASCIVKQRCYYISVVQGPNNVVSAVEQDWCVAQPGGEL